jgi:hypothetical protein
VQEITSLIGEAKELATLVAMDAPLDGPSLKSADQQRGAFNAVDEINKFAINQALMSKIRPRPTQGINLATWHILVILT